jgi:hypothetical protein
MTTKIVDLASGEVAKMEEASLNDLYRTIGVRMMDAQEATSAEQLQELGSFHPTIHADPTTLALTEDLVDFGRKLTKRVNKAAYSFFCEEASEEEREDFFDKLNLGTGDIAAMLAAVLVAQLAVAPAVAAVVAAAIVKLIVVPTIKTTCDTWGEAIEDT